MLRRWPNSALAQERKSLLTAVDDVTGHRSRTQCKEAVSQRRRAASAFGRCRTTPTGSLWLIAAPHSRVSDDEFVAVRLKPDATYDLFSKMAMGPFDVVP